MCAHFKIRPEADGQEPGRDFVIVHNPFATVPFPFDRVKSGREYFMRIDVRDHRLRTDDRDECTLHGWMRWAAEQVAKLLRRGSG